MTSIESLKNHQDHYFKSFHDHLPQVSILQYKSKHELLPSLISSSNLSNNSINALDQFLNDKVNLFKFLKSHHYDIDDSIASLSQCLQWRLNFNIDIASPSSLDPIYVEPPLLFFHPDLKDKWNRTCGVLKLKHIVRTDDGSLDGLKEFLAWSWELARKSIYHSTSQAVEKLTSSNQHEPSFTPIPLQTVMIIDLENASMSNLEVELLPYLLDLLKNNFPGMVATIFILNYGWMYAGMWQVVKRILPQSTLNRIIFPTQNELLQFFYPQNLLVEYGGQITHQPGIQNNQFFARFAHPPTFDESTAPQEISCLSSVSSVESLHDIFFSASNTPFYQPSHPSTPNRFGSLNNLMYQRPNWLNMTNFNPSQLSSTVARDTFKRNQGKSSIRPWLTQEPLQNFQLRLPNQVQLNLDQHTCQPSRVNPSESDSLSSTTSALEPFDVLSDQDEFDKETKNIKNSLHRPHRLSHWLTQSVTSFFLPSHRTPSTTSRRKKRDFFIRLTIRLNYFYRIVQMITRVVIRGNQKEMGRSDGTSNEDSRKYWVGITGLLLILLVGKKVKGKELPNQLSIES